jgi:adenylate cyclase
MTTVPEGTAGPPDHGLRQELTGQLPAFLRDLLQGDGEDDDRAEEDAGHDPVDLQGDQREVVQALVELGVEEVEACRAVATGRVPLVIAQHRRREKERYDVDELSRRSGVPVDLIQDLHMAMGLPTPARFTRRDLAWARQVRRFLDVMSIDALMRSARVRGNALATVARADLAIVRDELLVPMRQAGADDLTMAVALADAAEALEDIGREALIHAYEAQVDAQLDGELVAMAARSDADEVDIAVGFIDVEGYTALSARIDPAGLDAVIDAFEQRVLEVTSNAVGVSPVKYLGDAVMLVSADVGELAEVMLELTQPVDDLVDAPLRGGLSFGPVLVREGDYYGTTVNVAARLTDHARAWKVLADEEIRPLLADRFQVHAIRPMRMRGLGTRRPLVVLGVRD